jgi:hypothetical protein
VPVKVKNYQIFPNETKSCLLKGLPVKALKKKKNQILRKRNSKSSARKGVRVQVSPPAPQ